VVFLTEALEDVDCKLRSTFAWHLQAGKLAVWGILVEYAGICHLAVTVLVVPLS